MSREERGWVLVIGPAAVIRLSFNRHWALVITHRRGAEDAEVTSFLFSPDPAEKSGTCRTKENKKEHLADYPLELFTIRTIPFRITGILICKRALLFGRLTVMKGLVFSFLSSQSRLRRDVLCASAVNSGFSIFNIQFSIPLPFPYVKL